MGVFQQTGRTDGNRRSDHIKEGQEVIHQTLRQTGTEESLQDYIIVRIAQTYLIQIVGIHEFIEDIRTENHRLRNSNRCIFKFLKFCMTLHHVVYKSQTTAFSSQRTFANTGKIGIMVETVALENGYHPTVLHLTVFYNGFENHLTMTVHILQGIPSNLFQELCRREHGTRIEPTGNMIMLYMIQERFRRYMEYDILQFLQIPYTGHFFQGMRITEHEIAETEIVGHDIAQVHIHLLGILVYKACFILADVFPVVYLGRLENQWHKRIMLANFCHQLDTSYRIYDSFPWITGIRNNSQHIILIPII